MLKWLFKVLVFSSLAHVNIDIRTISAFKKAAIFLMQLWWENDLCLGLIWHNKILFINFSINAILLFLHVSVLAIYLFIASLQRTRILTLYKTLLATVERLSDSEGEMLRDVKRISGCLQRCLQLLLGLMFHRPLLWELFIAVAFDVITQEKLSGSHGFTTKRSDCECIPLDEF